ncbi:Ppx/GppA phosphatase [Flexistipes sinusarabici DSM 4947]|uniref:Ppx/GppA phosphatase n=1 Tax=Flexistipes sinusarabici (strain ATCC 49648 / DSM 4947 / MAS 10) TaxID=717231 RepID=F8E6Z5_FLESM|nr:Ppx/GppA phosphatase [Flexistipes sinusarabici]AEI14858.1 Ppx/GppA phosphatase [Flexistipes sinusarabici DSM 4947]
MLAAGVDIGSNSFRLIIADIEDDKILKIVHEERTITRLAEGLIETGRLKKENIDHSVEVLSSFRKKINEFGVNKFKFVATSAVREAENASEFLDKLAKKGIYISVIDGKYEGLLTFKGVNAAIDITGRNVLIFDIGGGSTELIFVDNGKVKTVESTELGVVKLSNLYDFKKIVDGKTIAKVESNVKKVLGNFYFSKEAVQKAAATAGTATTVAAIDMGLKDYDYRKVNGYTIDISKIKSILKELAGMPFEKRTSVTGLEKGREDLIIGGIIIMLSILEIAGTNKVTISDFGVREGIVIAAAND